MCSSDLTMFLLSPIMVPIIVIALGLYFYFAALRITGSELSLIMAHTVYTTPFVIVTAMAGLKHVDRNLETAATIMGAGPLRVFFKVTLPLLKPAMFAGGLFAFVRVAGCEHSTRLSNDLLEQAHVVTIPGAAFGRSGEGFLRLSYGYADQADLAEAISRLRRFFGE